MTDEPGSRRILHVFLPRLSTDRLARDRGKRGEEADRPPSATIPRATIPHATVEKSRGAVLLAAVDDRAAALGLAPGQGLADARAMVPGLLVDPADPAADAAVLDALARASDRYTPLVGRVPPDGLVLDITGCSHLFGGEAAMLADVHARHARAGFAARLAVASRPSVAWAVARYGAGGIVPSGEEIAAVAPLPVAALRLTEEVVAVLRRVGLKTVGDVLRQPRAPLVQRFGPLLARRMDAVEGRTDEPITPVAPVPPVIAERRFAEPVADTASLETVLQALATEAARVLERRGEGARMLRLRLFHADGAVHEASVGASEPLADPARIGALLVPRLRLLAERIEADAGVDLVRLHAAETAPLAARQVGFDGVEQVAADLARLIDTLSERLGADAVRRYVGADTHDPVLAGLTRPAREVPLAPAAERPRPAGFADVPALVRRADRQGVPPRGEAPPLPDWAVEAPPLRPLRLFTPPEPVEAVASVPDGPPIRFRWRRVSYLVAAAEGPERIASAWWEAETGTSDYFRVEDVEGRRFWMLRRGLYGEGTLPRWFVHGLFA